MSLWLPHITALWICPPAMSISSTIIMEQKVPSPPLVPIVPGMTTVPIACYYCPKEQMFKPAPGNTQGRWNWDWNQEYWIAAWTSFASGGTQIDTSMLLTSHCAYIKGDDKTFDFGLTWVTSQNSTFQRPKGQSVSQTWIFQSRFGVIVDLQSACTQLSS